MTNKIIMTICIDEDLVDIVNELKARRSFSKFVQECLRSHKKVIQAESLQHEKKSIELEIKKLNDRMKIVSSELQKVDKEAAEQANIIELEKELLRLNSMKKDMSYLEDLPFTKRPKHWHEWNNKRQSIGRRLKDLGFDFKTLNQTKGEL